MASKALLAALLFALSIAGALADCAHGSVRDVSGRARIRCVDDTLRVQCDGGADVTVHADSGLLSFRNVVRVRHFWFGFGSGAPAVYLGTSAAVSCAASTATSCTNSACAFIHGGGTTEPTQTCTSDGSLARSCVDGSLYVGREAYDAALCNADGSFTLVGSAENTTNTGTLTAGCAPTACSNPVLLASEQLSADVVAATTEVTSADAYSRVSCGAGTAPAISSSSGVLLRPGYSLSCSAASNQWVVLLDGEHTANYNSGSGAFGCVQPAVEAPTLLDASSTVVTSSSQYVFVAAQLSVSVSLQFVIECPFGTSLGYEISGALVIGTNNFRLYFDGATWLQADDIDSIGSAVNGSNYGCFADACADTLTLIAEADLPEGAQLAETVVTVESGVNAVVCAAGAQLAQLVDGTLTISSSSLACDQSAAAAAEWQLNATVVADGVAVACIEPSCPAISLCDGTEAALLESNYDFQLTQLSFDGEHFVFECPEGYAVGYIETPSFITITNEKLTCTSGNWTTETESSWYAAGVKVGCFQPRAYDAWTCFSLTLLTADDVVGFTGIQVDESQVAVFNDNAIQLACSAGSQLAYKVGGTLFFVEDAYLSCTDFLADWQLIFDSGAQIAFYVDVVVGCVQPTCTGVSVFSHDDSLLVQHPLYTLAQPSIRFFRGGIYEVVCPAGTYFGYEEAGEFIYDDELRVTCESDSWLASGETFNGTKGGCFTRLEACPDLSYFEADDLVDYEGVDVEPRTADRYLTGVHSFRCTTGTFPAVLEDGEITVGGWQLTCDEAQDVGWQFETESDDGEVVAVAYANETVGCVRPACRDSDLFNVFDSSEETFDEAYHHMLTPYAYNADTRLFDIVCADGYELGFVFEDELNVTSDLSITCEGTTWTIAAADDEGNGTSVGTAKFGCFREYTSSCPKLEEFEAADVNATDFTSMSTIEAVWSDGVTVFECPSGSYLAYVSDDGSVRVVYGRLECDDESAEGWHFVYDADAGSDESADTYNATSIACIQPACASLRLFSDDSDESEEVDLHQYYVIDASFTFDYTTGQFSFGCPDGYEIGVVSGGVLSIEANISITCEGLEWTVTSAVTEGGEVASGSYGCFRDVGSCAKFALLTNADLNSTDYAVVADVQYTWSSGVTTFSCPSGSALVLVSEGTLEVIEGGFECSDEEGSSWLLLLDGDSEDSTDYSNATIACIQPTCTGLSLIEGDDSSSEDYDAISATYSFNVATNQFEVSCADGYRIGTFLGGLINIDIEISITCEGLTWQVTSSDNSTSEEDGLSQYGCFREREEGNETLTSNCTELSLLTVDDITSSSFIIEANTDYGYGDGQFQCPSGSYLALINGEDVTVINGHLACNESGSWQIVFDEEEDEESEESSDDYDLTSITCIKPSCTDLNLYEEGNSSSLSSLEDYDVISATFTFNVVTKQFEVSCADGYRIGTILGGLINIDIEITITCEGLTWQISTSDNSTAYEGSTAQYACVRENATNAGCGARPLLSQQDFNSSSIKIDAFYDPFEESACAAGSSLAMLVDGELYVDGLSLACDGDQWKLRGQFGNEFSISSAVPVGCITPACEALEVIAADSLASNGAVNETFVEATADFDVTRAQFVYSCPCGYTLGYVDDAGALIVDVTLAITCTDGEWIATSYDDRSGSVCSYKIGCFVEEDE